MLPTDLGADLRNTLLAVLLLCLAACSQKAWINRLASDEEQRLAIATAEELRNGDAAKITQQAEPQFKADVPKASSQVRPLLTRAPGPFAIKTVSVVEQSGGSVMKAFTLQAGAGTNWTVTEIVFSGRGRSLQLAGFHVLASSSDPSKLNDFSIGKRGLLGYVWLLLMCVCPALCLTAVVLIWRRRWLKRRWLWTVGSLLGFTGFGLNWSTGAWAFLLINVSALGAGATRAGPFSPWILTFGIPVVAIVVIVRWLRLAQRDADAIANIER
jgi:hypothetical protein